MNEGKRQKQVGAEIQKQMNEIFLRMGLNMQQGGMVSISGVKVTPDLLEARIYLSLFHTENDDAIIENIRSKTNEIRGSLGNIMRHQLRLIPQLTFYKDDTLDHVFKIEKLLNEIKAQNRSAKDTNSQTSNL